uniref:peptidylprolyl isomerase n=1 Tax=Bionectria ochroleuca TaxID=29856 RepID=A0A8H7TVH4_BIOOC
MSLQIEVTQKGNGDREAKAGDNVSVHYRGYDRGKPLAFKLGAGQVIQGWDQGISGMVVGEKRKLTIPPSLGYGNQKVGPIPAGSILGTNQTVIPV